MDAAAFAPRRLWPHEKLTPRRHQKLTAPTEEGMIEMLLGQSSPLRGDLVGGEMPAPDEVTAVVGGCTNWLSDEANCRRVGAAGTGEALSCGERLVAVHQLRRERRLNRLAEWLAERFPYI